jgi:hypothetical protein
MRRHYPLLGRLVPLVLAVFFAFDVGLRQLPLDLISFRAWEVLTQYAPYDASFEPNLYFRSDVDFGDLANLANLPNFKEYRAGTTFTTDSFGFRNSPSSLLAGIPDAILNGDSFGVGATVDDTETPAVQLGSLSGCRIYNAAGGLDLQVEQIVTLAQRLGMKRGLVIDMVLESAIFLRRESPPPAGMYERVVSAAPESLRDPLIRLRGLWTISPLKILANRGVRLLEDDRVLPNSYAAPVIQRTLRTGEKTLFVREDIEYARNVLAVSTDRWTRFASRLEQAGLTFVVVLVPRKYTVYQPLLIEEDPLPADQLGGTLIRLEQQIRDAGIPVVNLTAAFRAHAGRELDHVRYLYRRDDAHWNARGIGVAAAEIARGLRTELAAHCRRGR